MSEPTDTTEEASAPQDGTSPTSTPHGFLTGAVKGIVSTGGKAVHKIASPLEGAVRNTVDSLHGKNRTRKAEILADNPEEKETASLVTDDKVEPESTEESSKHGSSSFFEETKAATSSAFKAVVEKTHERGEKVLETLAAPVKRISDKSGDATSDAKAGNQDEVDLADVPPDATLQKMNIIVSKRLKDVSIPDFYEIVWSEGNRTNRKPLYGPWLEESGKTNVVVGDWAFADEGDEFVGGWCEEKYPQKRTVTCIFEKNIPLRAGPTVANVTHTQYCRVEGKDKCVMQITTNMEGIPFSDCFKVELRWVASRSGKNDIAIQIGLFVNFVKSTVVASKIRSGTIEETTSAQLSLFLKTKQACGATEEEVAELREVEAAPEFSCAPLLDLLTFWRRSILGNREDDIAVNVRSADNKLKAVIDMLESSDPIDTSSVVRDQLKVVNDALDAILSTKS